MKKFLRLLCALAIMVPASVLGQSYQINDGVLKYVIDTKTKEAAVMECLKPSQTKEIVILDEILFQETGKTYKVTSIWSSAFEKCKLKSVRFPVGLKEIEANAFADCPNFYKGKDFEIPSGVTTIGMDAFNGCKFTSLTLPSSLTKVDEGAFENTSIVSIKIKKPKSSLQLDFRVFRGCKKLTSVSIPEGVTKLGQAIFADCTALTSVSIPSTIVTISSMGFEDCTALKTVKLSEGNKKIAFQAFVGTGIEEINLPSTIKTIEQNAFSASKLRSISLPYGLKEVAYCAFSGCANLTGVAIPATVTKIDSGAFNGCTNLNSVFIPSSVKEIGQAAFYDCHNLMLVSSDATTPAECEGTVWGDATLEHAQLMIPESAKSSYKNAYGWKDFRWLYTSAVGSIETDENQEGTLFYDLNGVCYSSTPVQKGIYVKVTGNKKEKIIVR